MFKRFFLSLSLLAGLIAPALGYGTIPYSLTQQFGTDGKPLSGGKLYLIQAGTTATPQNCYQDAGLTIAWPNPITLDSAGRVPQLFCADGSIKVRLTNAAGVNQVSADNILVVGPSGGGGGGSSVDATTILATGDFKMVYGTGNLTGFVRCNGRTIGSATSGASERANADTSSLYSYLWSADANLSVSTGRGASAAADFAANKTLALPDCRGRNLTSLGDMGNSATSIYTSTYAGCTVTTLGATCGTQAQALATPNLPPYTPSGSISGTITINPLTAATGTSFGTTVPKISDPNGGAISSLVPTGSFSGSFTGTAQGGTSTPFSLVQPSILITTYIKL